MHEEDVKTGTRTPVVIGISADHVAGTVTLSIDGVRHYRMTPHEAYRLIRDLHMMLFVLEKK